MPRENMDKFIAALKNFEEKYKGLVPILIFIGLFLILWLNANYTPKSEFSNHETSDKITYQQFETKIDKKITDIQVIVNKMDEKLDILIADNVSNKKQFETLSLGYNRNKDDILEVKNRVLYLERNIKIPNPQLSLIP